MKIQYKGRLAVTEDHVKKMKVKAAQNGRPIQCETFDAIEAHLIKRRADLKAGKKKGI